MRLGFSDIQGAVDLQEAAQGSLARVFNLSGLNSDFAEKDLQPME